MLSSLGLVRMSDPGQVQVAPIHTTGTVSSGQSV